MNSGTPQTHSNSKRFRRHAPGVPLARTACHLAAQATSGVDACTRASVELPAMSLIRHNNMTAATLNHLGCTVHAGCQRLGSWHGGCAAGAGLLYLTGRQPALRCSPPAQEAEVGGAAPICCSRAVLEASQGPVTEPILPAWADPELPKLQLQVGCSGGIVGGCRAQSAGCRCPQAARSGALENGVSQGGSHRRGNTGLDVHTRAGPIQRGLDRSTGWGNRSL